MTCLESLCKSGMTRDWTGDLQIASPMPYPLCPHVNSMPAILVCNIWKVQCPYCITLCHGCLFGCLHSVWLLQQTVTKRLARWIKTPHDMVLVWVNFDGVKIHPKLGALLRSSLPIMQKKSYYYYYYYYFLLLLLLLYQRPEICTIASPSRLQFLM